MARWGKEHEWVTERGRWDDIESDLSAFHRIDVGTALDLPPRVLWSLVDRIAAYRGVVRFRFEAETLEQAQPDVQRLADMAGAPGQTSGARVVTEAEMALIDNGQGFFGPEA